MRLDRGMNGREPLPVTEANLRHAAHVLSHSDAPRGGRVSERDALRLVFEAREKLKGVVPELGDAPPEDKKKITDFHVAALHADARAARAAEAQRGEELFFVDPSRPMSREQLVDGLLAAADLMAKYPPQTAVRVNAGGPLLVSGESVADHVAGRRSSAEGSTDSSETLEGGEGKDALASPSGDVHQSRTSENLQQSQADHDLHSAWLRWKKHGLVRDLKGMSSDDMLALRESIRRELGEHAPVLKKMSDKSGTTRKLGVLADNLPNDSGLLKRLFPGISDDFVLAEVAKSQTRRDSTEVPRASADDEPKSSDQTEPGSKDIDDVDETNPTDTIAAAAGSGGGSEEPPPPPGGSPGSGEDPGGRGGVPRRPKVRHAEPIFKYAGSGGVDVRPEERIYRVHFEDDEIPHVDLDYADLQAAGIRSDTIIDSRHPRYNDLAAAAYQKRERMAPAGGAEEDEEPGTPDDDPDATLSPAEKIRKQIEKVEEEIRKAAEGVDTISSATTASVDNATRLREQRERLEAWRREEERLRRLLEEDEEDEDEEEGEGEGDEEEGEEGRGHSWHPPRNASEWAWFAAAVGIGSWYAVRFFFKNVAHPILHSIGYVSSGDDKHPWQTLIKNTEAEFKKAFKMKGEGGSSSGSGHGGGHGGH